MQVAFSHSRDCDGVGPEPRASSQSSSRSSYYGPAGAAAGLGRRSSWNSLKHSNWPAEHESLLSAERGGARAARVPGTRPARIAPVYAPHD